jgi:hypothetical protein
MGEWYTRCLTHHYFPRATHGVGYSLEWDSIPLATVTTPLTPLATHRIVKSVLTSALSPPLPPGSADAIRGGRGRRLGPAGLGPAGGARLPSAQPAQACPPTLSGLWIQWSVLYDCSGMFAVCIWFQTCSGLPGTKPRNPTEQIRLLWCVWHAWFGSG